MNKRLFAFGRAPAAHIAKTEACGADGETGLCTNKKRGKLWLDSDKELIEIINCRLTVSGAEKVRKSEMLNRCFPNLFRLRLSVHFADVQNL